MSFADFCMVTLKKNFPLKLDRSGLLNLIPQIISFEKIENKQKL